MLESDQIDDLEIVAQVQLGKTGAYEKIVRKYQSRIRNFCAQLLSDAALGEDAAQDVFVRAYQSIGSFSPNPSFSSWLFRIARNLCIDLLRKRNLEKSDSLEDLEEREGGVSISRQIAATNNIDVVEARDTIIKLLKLLPQKYREVLILREAYGLSYEEISSILNCTADAVKARLKRARSLI